MTPWKPTAIGLATLALLTTLPCLAQAQPYVYKWYPGTGLAPTETCLPWELLNTASPEVPNQNPVRLKLSTSSTGEIMMYTMQGPDLSLPGGDDDVFIQFRMRYVSGNTTDSSRRVACVLFQTADPIGGSPLGNILWIGKDDIFLWSADATVGPRAFVDTDDSYHTYKIVWNMADFSVRVYRDGSSFPTLTGTSFSRPQWTSVARIAWGHQFFGAQGQTLWHSMFHSYYGPYDDDGDQYTPDSCDNCESVGNATQDDIDHDGIGNACDVNDSLQFRLLSPVDMVVTDPALDSIGKTFNIIQAGSSYTDNTDVSGDGDPDDIVTIPRPLSGSYLVRIFAEPGAIPEDRYTLTIRINGNQLITPEGHQDAPVSSLPAVFLWNAAGTTCGDVNADGSFSASDLIYLVNFVFKGGPGPIIPGHGDTDCNNATTSADIIRLVNFVFKSGTPPCSRTADFPAG